MKITSTRVRPSHLSIHTIEPGVPFVKNCNRPKCVYVVMEANHRRYVIDLTQNRVLEPGNVGFQGYTLTPVEYEMRVEMP